MHSKVSLVIPVKDEEGSISALLESIRRQVHPPDEIVITDAGSADRTAEIIEEHIRKGLPVNLIKTPRAYPGTARNSGIGASRYELIAMTDAGIRLDADWLRELIRPFEEGKDVDMVYGSYEPIRDSFFKKCLALVFLPSPIVVDGVRVFSHSIASCLMRKEVWRRVGGFPDFRAAEDRIFMDNAERLGFKVGYAPRAKVLWEIPAGFKSTFRRFSNLSFHDLKAARFRDWHRPVIVMYALGITMALFGIIFSPLWFVLLLLGVFIRALGLIREKCCGEPFCAKPDLRTVILVALIMVWVDLAMFWGLIKYVLYRAFKI